MLYEDRKKEIETIKERTLVLKLSDADCDRILQKAASHGMTVSELLESFIGDLSMVLSPMVRTNAILLRIGSTAAVLSVMIRERCCGICWSRTQTSKILSNSMRRTKNTNRTQRSLRSSVKNTKWSQVTRSILKMNCSIGWTIGSRAS